MGAVAGVLRQRRQHRIVEAAGDAVDLGLRQGGRTVLKMDELGLDLAGELFHAQRLHQDLDARLVGVVAAAVQVVDAQDGAAVVEDLLPGHEGGNFRADDRRAAQTAAHQHAEAQLAGLVVHQVQADVVDLDQRAVLLRAIHRDLELARQEGEFRMEGAPLAQDLAPRARIDDLVGGDAGEGVGGDVADAVARSLDGVHLHAGEQAEDFGHVFQLGPVELDVLARGDVGIAAVVAAGDVAQHAQLLRVQVAVGHGDAQHRCMALDVDAVLQAQRAEFVLAQFAGEVAPGLIGELGDALIDDALVVFVVLVHRIRLSGGSCIRCVEPGTGRAACQWLAVSG